MLSLTMLGIAILAGLVVSSQWHSKKVLAESKTLTQQKATRIADNISQKLEVIQPIVADLATQVGGGISGAELATLLEQEFNSGRQFGLLEVGVAYKPDNGQLRAPHYGIKDGVEQQFNVEESYDYSLRSWYRGGMREDARMRGHWSEPYFGQATQQWAAGYVKSFGDASPGGPDGVARINFRLDEIWNVIAQEPVGKTGYAFVYSEERRIIAHPVRRFVGQEVVNLGSGDGVISGLVKVLDSGDEKDGIIRIQDAITREIHWVVVRAIGDTGWSTAVVFNHRDVLIEGTRSAAYFRSIVIMSVLVVIGLITYFAGQAVSLRRRGWRIAIVSSLAFLGAIIALWVEAVTTEAERRSQDRIVLDEASAMAAIAHQERDGTATPELLHVPTGVFVQSVRFVGANDVTATGYIWQRAAVPGTPPPGVILPEAETIDIEEAYRSRDGSTVGWYFHATLRQPFDYSKYPFDREDVWIRLWPKDWGSGRPMVLVPDFAGYTQRKMDEKPGIEADFVLEGWNIVDSFFSYRDTQYSVNFGLEDESTAFSGRGQANELYFNIGLRRDFVGPFIADMVPLTVIAFLLFAVLMSMTKHETQVGLFGFSTSAVLAYCAALFFVLIVSHVHLRETLASTGIIYLENFFFVMYGVILVVSANSLLFASALHVSFIHHLDNLLVKQTFWPVVTGSLFVVTLFSFP